MVAPVVGNAVDAVGSLRGFSRVAQFCFVFFSFSLFCRLAVSQKPPALLPRFCLHAFSPVGGRTAFLRRPLPLLGTPLIWEQLADLFQQRRRSICPPLL